MQGPLVDIVLLLLLMLFFGQQQHSRPQMHYRYWFAGWIFVCLSYMLWEVKLTRPVMVQAQDAARFDLMLIGLLLFLMSFLSSEKQLWKTMAIGAFACLPGVVLIDFNQFEPARIGWLLLVILAGESYGLYAAYRLIPAGRVKTRAAIFAICGASAILIPIYLALVPGARLGSNLGDCWLTEVLLCTAVLYGGGLRRRSVAVSIGILGLLLWAAFYHVINNLGPNMPWLRHILYQCWLVPKYFVGFSMILKIFEDVAEENEQLAEDFRTVYESHVHPMWIYESENGQCLSVNAAAVKEYGYSREEFLAMRVEDLELVKDIERDAYLDILPKSEDEDRTRHRLKDGRMIWVNVVDRPITFQGRAASVVMARDITERLRVSQELSRQANHDALTGLPNRILLEDRIQQCMARSDRDARKAVLLTIDVDHFKRINDTYGHLVGDECLRMVAARLAAKIRQVDTLARIGGEEFAAIIGGVQRMSDVTKIAENLLGVFDTPVKFSGCIETITVSIGIAIYPDDAVDVGELKRRSDEALYAAKKAGRNCAVDSASLRMLVPVRIKYMEPALEVVQVDSIA